MSVTANGIRVITEAMPRMRSVSAGCWIGTGSRAESAAESGIAHFIEHMLFKGTSDRNAGQIAREMDALGGELDAFTDREEACFSVKVLDEQLGVAFPILADMLVHPKFDAAEIDKEKGVILEEMKAENDDPESVVHDLFLAQLWPGAALSRPIIGTKRTIARFGREAVRRYHERHYTGANLTVSAAGSLRHEEVVELVERHLGALPAGEAVQPEAAPAARAARALKRKQSLEQVQLCVGTPFCRAAHEWRYAAYAMNTLLGGSMSSRLFQNIREERGLAYSIYSELNLFADAGCLAVYAGTAPDKAGEVVELILAQLDRLRREPVGEEELRRTREHLKASLLLGLESTGSRMSNLARQWLIYGRFYTMDELSAAVDAVTSEQIQHLARTYFQSDGIALAAVGRTDALARAQGALVC